MRLYFDYGNHKDSKEGGGHHDHDQDHNGVERSTDGSHDEDIVQHEVDHRDQKHVRDAMAPKSG